MWFQGQRVLYLGGVPSSAACVEGEAVQLFIPPDLKLIQVQNEAFLGMNPEGPDTS